jgi:hypothetical protein
MALLAYSASASAKALAASISSLLFSSIAA